MSYYLFQKFPKETLEVEYKEFSYKIDPEIYYEQQEINDIVLGKKKIDERFNKSILDNLKHYCKFYIPKYLSAFCNAKLKTTGKLFIGVDDDGEIVGIPYLGQLPKETIVNYMMKQIHDSILTTNATMNYIKKNIKISIEPLTIYPNLITSNLDRSIEKVNRLYTNYKTQIDQYQIQFENWYSKLTKYSIKLVELVETPEIFREIFQYIAARDSSKLFVLNQNIETSMAEIIKHKENTNHILYWVCKFRDDKLDEILLERPTKPKIRPRKITYVHEFVKLSNLRKSFLQHPQMNYYLIFLEIPPQCPDEVFYKDIYGTIQKKTRTLDKGEPVCKEL